MQDDKSLVFSNSNERSILSLHRNLKIFTYYNISFCDVTQEKMYDLMEKSYFWVSPLKQFSNYLKNLSDSFEEIIPNFYQQYFWKLLRHILKFNKWNFIERNEGNGWIRILDIYKSPEKIWKSGFLKRFEKSRRNFLKIFWRIPTQIVQ